MTSDNDIIGGNAKDNGPLDAFLKGERISTNALILIKLQEAFALKARECNEHQDFEDKGGQRWSQARHAAWVARQRRLSALETASDAFESGRATKGFNKAGSAREALQIPAYAPVFTPAPGLT